MTNGGRRVEMRRQIFFFHMVTLIVALLTLLACERRRAPSGIPRLSGPGGPGRRQPLRPGAEHSEPAGRRTPETGGSWTSSWAKLDYRLVVEQNHQVVYSSLDRFQEELYNRIFARRLLAGVRHPVPPGPGGLHRGAPVRRRGPGGHDGAPDPRDVRTAAPPE